MTGTLRVAVLGQGTRGDLYPLLGVARQLAARGHRVDVLEFDEYRHDVADAGLAFRAVGTGSQCASVFAAVPTGPVTRRTEWVIGRLYFEASLATAAAFATAVAALSPPPDALLAPGHHVGAVLTSELLGVPLVPVFLGPAVLGLVSGTGPDGARAAPGREQALIDRFVRPRLAGVRAALGMPPAAPPPSFSREPDRGGLLLAPRVLLGDDVPVPPAFDVAGYPHWFGPEGPAVPPGTEEFLARDDAPLVVCSLGDGWARALPDQLHRLAARAVEGRYRLVVVGGRMSGLPSGPGVLVAPAACLRLLLGHAAVCVHHGGMGTVVAALRAAVPSVTLPQWPDGRRNAQLLARRGLGTDVGSRCGPDDVDRAVDDALADGRRRARLRAVRDALPDDPDPASVLLARLARPAPPASEGAR